MATTNETNARAAADAADDGPPQKSMTIGAV